jgi:hypothetical protein
MENEWTREMTREWPRSRKRALGTASDGALRLNVSVPSFHHLRREGLLPAGVVVQVGRRVRVDLDALEAWISAGGQALAGGWRREPSGGNK